MHLYESNIGVCVQKEEQSIKGYEYRKVQLNSIVIN